VEPSELDWGIARGLAGFRAVAWVWAVAVLVVTRADLARPAAAAALLGVAGVVTAVAGRAAIRRQRWLLGPAAVVGEVAVAAALLVADGWVYDEVHGQTFGSAWPVAGVLAAGLVLGPAGGIAAGAAVGLARAAGVAIAPFDGAGVLSLVSSGVLFMLAGGAAGAVAVRVRRAESTVARARAREEVARTLHDGVLQMLAVVQRRADDADLVALARDQELELRAFLAGDRVGPGSHDADDDLGAALRRAAALVERRHGLRSEVLVVDDDSPAVASEVVAALAGAVQEALTNAARHGGAARATVFVEVDGEVFCSVKDDGSGFDPAAVTLGLGIPESIHGRLAEVGGRAEIDAAPARGTEVRLHAPRTAPPR
jgi:signal transduction histidine kinase